MKELFNIQSGKREPGKECLSLRIGERHCSYAVTDLAGSELYELAYCTVDNLNENELSAFRSAYPRVAEPYRQVWITYDNARASLVPARFYHPQQRQPLLAALHGDTYGLHLVTDELNAWQICNVYSVPLDVHDWINQQYPVVSIRHQYSVLLKQIPIVTDGCILAEFRPSEFCVVAAVGGKLLVAQTYEYETPADVLYYLLRICYRFSLDAKKVSVRISGLLVKNSALHFDLEQYFLNVELREASWKDTVAAYPLHFFTSLNDLALCAS